LEVVQRYLHVREEELAPELAMVEKPRVCQVHSRTMEHGRFKRPLLCLESKESRAWVTVSVPLLV
jgi:hypothetical protein